MGNSSYGKTITDQECHREVQFCEETKASRLINKPFFRQIDQIEENTYEGQSCKKKKQVEPSHADRFFRLTIR